jgi:hypothetical protein
MWKSRKFKQLFPWTVLSSGTKHCHYIPEDRNLHNHRSENLKSYILTLYLKRLFWTFPIVWVHYKNYIFETGSISIFRRRGYNRKPTLSHSVHLKTERKPITKTQWFEQSQTRDKVQNNSFKQCVTPLSKHFNLIFPFLVNIILIFKAIY